MKRISTRLAISFLLVALLPTLPLSLVVRDLLERRFGPAIADPLELRLKPALTRAAATCRNCARGSRVAPSPLLRPVTPAPC
ncbi:MAG: hypothetical protein IPO18_08060 [bacterium]|nr:hypothetical protein [bacterium]